MYSNNDIREQRTMDNSPSGWRAKKSKYLNSLPLAEDYEDRTALKDLTMEGHRLISVMD